MIGGAWLFTDHARVPFASFFGDEEYFIRRATWLRNVALGIPIHNADMIYAFDDYSYTHYLYVIAFIEAFVGFAPYGLKAISAAMYLAGAVILFRLARRALRQRRRAGGAAGPAFLPSLFAWSIAALKEPPYFLIGRSGMLDRGGHDAHPLVRRRSRRRTVPVCRRRRTAIHP